MGLSLGCVVAEFGSRGAKSTSDANAATGNPRMSHLRCLLLLRMRLGLRRSLRWGATVAEGARLNGPTFACVMVDKGRAIP